MNRYIYDVTLTDGTVVRWNCTGVTTDFYGRLLIYDYGLIRVYGATEWRGLELVETIPVEAT